MKNIPCKMLLLATFRDAVTLQTLGDAGTVQTLGVWAEDGVATVESLEVFDRC